MSKEELRGRVRLLVEGAEWPHEVESVADTKAALKRLPVRDRVLLLGVAMGYTQAELGRMFHIQRPDNAYSRAEKRLAKELAA